MTTTKTVESLYRVHAGRVDFVDVPELGYVVVDGAGAPQASGFQEAMQALFSVSYGAHFLLRKEGLVPPRVLPLEAQWWVDDPEQQDIVMAVALGQATMQETDAGEWRWRAMIAQLEPIDEGVVERAVEAARAKSVPALDRIRYVRWEEGRCVQTLHVGSYADEGPTLVALHAAIAAAGLRPRGHHHEIYLGDPRRAAPEKLRTLLRHPVTED